MLADVKQKRIKQVEREVLDFTTLKFTKHRIINNNIDLYSDDEGNH